MQDKSIWKITRREILCSLIVSAITLICIQPLWNFVLELILGQGNILYVYILNYIITLASLGYNNELFEVFYIAIFSGFSGFSSVLIFDFIRSNLILRKTIKKYEIMVANQMKPELAKEKDTVNEAKRANLYSWKIGTILAILLLSFICLYVLSYYTMSSANKMNQYFDRNLNILSFYVEEIKIKELKADWARMENYNDYKNILSKMEELAGTENIKLRKMLLNG